MKAEAIAVFVKEAANDLFGGCVLPSNLRHNRAAFGGREYVGHWPIFENPDSCPQNANLKKWSDCLRSLRVYCGISVSDCSNAFRYASSCLPMNLVYAGGIASFNSFFVIQLIPIASRAATTVQFPPPVT